MDLNEVIILKDKLETLMKDIGKYQIEEQSRSDLVVIKKTTSVDLVTEVDRGSEEKIIAFLNEQFPDHGIVAEESGVTESDSDYKWYIDPVDGTTNYAHGYPIWAIAIGLEYKGDMLLGCIYVPKLDEFYYGINGYGAFKNGKAIKVSSEGELVDSVIATGFPYDRKTTKLNNINYVSHLVPLVSGIRRSGSACFDIVNVANGHTEAYYELNIKLYDFKAASVILTEAGGTLSAKLCTNGYAVIAANKAIYSTLKENLDYVEAGIF